METEYPPPLGTFAVGPTEARVMLALITGIGYAFPRALAEVGQTPEARNALEAVKRMNGPEYDAVATMAAVIALPVIMDAFADVLG